MIFGLLPQNLKTQAMAVAFSIAWPGREVEPGAEDGAQVRDRLAGFRRELYRCLTARADALAFLRRFDIEHTFRFFKQALGWTRPRLRDPAAADRWTWLVIAAYAQLRLARHLAADLRLPWQRPCLPGRLTPARVRRGFRT